MSHMGNPASNLLPTLRTLVKGQTTAMVNTICALAEINSFSGNPAGCREVLKALASECRELPGDSLWHRLEKPGNSPGHYLPEAFAHHCRPQAAWTLLLNGHVDTVYPPDDPFQHCSIEGNLLRGPGVTDMKGGIVLMLTALRLFEQLPGIKNFGWEVLFTADEEVGSPLSTALLRQRAQSHRLGLVFESSRPHGAIIRRRMGSGTFHATVKGRKAHVGRDFHQGRNAIMALCSWLQDLHQLNDNLPGIILNVGKISGGGPLNVVPDTASAALNLRVAASEDYAAFTQSAHNILGRQQNAQPDCLLTWTGELTRPPKPWTTANQELFAALQSCAGQTGQTLTLEDTGGGTDGSILQDAGLPNLDSLGVIGDNLHSPQEHLLIDRLEERLLLNLLFLCHLNSEGPTA